MSTPKFVWIIDKNKIEVIFDDEYDLSKHHISVFSFSEESINIESIEKYEDCIVINTQNDLDLNQNYYITICEQALNAYLRRDVLDKYFIYEGKLGAQVKGSRLTHRVWAPSATELELFVYDKKDREKRLLVKKFKRIENGVFEIDHDFSKEGIDDLHGYFYHLNNKAYGKHTILLDPYAYSMEPNRSDYRVVPKAAFIDLERTNPDNYKSSKKMNDHLIEDRVDFVAQEIHVRNYTISKTSKVEKDNRGTYLGFAEKVDHLKDLGISHVQLMPLHSCFTVDETNRKFQDDQVPEDQINYNWGYDAHHYFIPNGWYSSNPEDPTLRIIELKKMIKSLHDKGIGAILDVVYNHMYSRDFLEPLAPGCYLRRTRDGYISTFTGAGDSLESRTKMVRRLIIDSLKHYCNEYHMNGFRFDLMGFTDIESMIEIRKELGDDVIIYGEAWEFTDIPGEGTTKQVLPSGYEIGAFNDSTRNAYVGEKGTVAYVQGDCFQAPIVRTGITGALRNYKKDYNGDGHLDVFIDEFGYHAFADAPANAINYLSIHDGHTLWDKINLSIRTDEHEKKKIYKLAIGMLLTSQGRVVLEEGAEMCSTKPLVQNDPNKHRAHTTSYVCPNSDGVRHFHENTYKSPDLTNMYDWSQLEKHDDIYEYLKGLIALRKKFACLRYETANEINDGLRFKCENIPNTPNFVVKDGTRHHNWDEVKKLKLEFINGPINEKMYLIGDVQGKDSLQKNPEKNKYFVEFDIDGKASIEFSKKEVADFDYGGWGEEGSLEFKLVRTPGLWEVPEEYYSKLGSNVVHPWSINNKTSRATIDLSKKDHTAGVGEIFHNNYIAYTLNCKKHVGKLLVIHNNSKKYTELQIKELAFFKSTEILVDNINAGVTPLERSAVEIRGDRVNVPGKTTTVIYCK